MSLNLTIVPALPGDGCNEYNACGTILAFSRLGLQNNAVLMDIISDIRAERLDVPVRDYTEDGIVERSDDAYGRPLTFIRPRQLKEALDQASPLLTDWDTAVCAFLSSLRENVRLILMWN